jgi:hypothetical protein
VTSDSAGDLRRYLALADWTDPLLTDEVVWDTVASVTFSATGATRFGWTHESAANHDGDTPAGSSGTTVAVAGH